MIFGHDTVTALNGTVDLVNTAHETCGEERLPDVASLRDFVSRNTLSGVDTVDDADVAALHALRDEFLGVYRAATKEQAVARVNGIVTAVRTTPRLTNHDGYDWHVHFFVPGAAVAEHLAADAGMALAYVISADERDRLRVCAAPDCSRVLVDFSKNRCRRYCDSRTCGNRMHVAAYRARRREALTPQVR